MKESRERRSQLLAEARALLEERRVALVRGRIDEMEAGQNSESSDDQD